MPTLTYNVSLSGGGTSISRSIPRTADGLGAREIALPPGKPGTLTTRTGDDAGVVTLAADHGVVSSDTVDVYWEGGIRYGMTATVSGVSVTLADGDGDNLPEQDTPVVVAKQVHVNATVDGDELYIIGIEASYNSPSSAAMAHLDMQDSGGDTIAELDLAANSPRVFDIVGGDSNPFTGNTIVVVLASNGSATEAATLKMQWLQDSTPDA